MDSDTWPVNLGQPEIQHAFASRSATRFAERWVRTHERHVSDIPILCRVSRLHKEFYDARFKSNYHTSIRHQKAPNMPRPMKTAQNPRKSATTRIMGK